MLKRRIPLALFFVLVAAVAGMAQLNRVSVNQIVGTLSAVKGGTGNAVYAVGDVLYASTTTVLSRLADVAGGSYLRSGGAGTAPVWSTLTLPNSATQGDLLVATGANAVGNIADVATGSVFASTGVGATPGWSATPNVTAISTGATPATSGAVRLTTAGAITWRNNANGADLSILASNASDQLSVGASATFNGNSILGVASYRLNGGNTFVSSTAPTIASGGCTSPAVSTSNGTAYFRITVGTSCTGVKTITLTMPAANNLWMCDTVDNTTPASNIVVDTSSSTTAVVLTNYARTTGLTADFTAGEILLTKCLGG